MNIIIPENKSDLLLNDCLELFKWKDLEEKDFNKKILEIIYKIPNESIDKMEMKDYIDLINSFNIVMNQESKFKKFIKINNIDYGFIPKFEDLKAGELIDLDQYLIDGNYNNIIGILYRPIISKDKKDRYLVDMNSDIDFNLFEDIDYETYEGCIGFFLTLLNQLEVIIVRYMEKVMKNMKSKKNPELELIRSKINLIKNGMVIPDFYGNYQAVI